jgi:hypothetical protein
VTAIAETNNQPQGGWQNLLQTLTTWRDSVGSGRAFSPAEHFLHRLDGVTPPSQRHAGGVRYWVLSRGLYAVRLMDLADIPTDKRAAAISLAALGWTPFADTRHYTIVEGQAALICAWDHQQVMNAQAAFDLDDDATSIVPETALREPLVGANTATASDEREIRMSACLDGVLASVGKGSRVEAEQWWPDTPTLPMWQNFLRSVGMSATARPDSLSVQTAAWRRAPVGARQGAAISTASTRERVALAVGAWLLVLPTIWYANQWWQVHQQKVAAQQTLAKTEAELNATLGARGQAIASLDRATRLAALFGQPDSLALFALVQDVLVQNGQSKLLQLAEWGQRGQELKLVFTAPQGGNVSAPLLVKAFEKVPSLQNVEVNVDGARTTVKLNVVPVSADKAVTPAAPSTANVTPQAGLK